MPTNKKSGKSKSNQAKGGNAKQQPKRKAKGKKKGAASTMACCARLSPCAKDYAEALGDPFSGPLACIPVYPSLPSERMRVWVKTGIQTGTAATGFISMNPFRMIASDSANPAVRFTGSTFGGTTIAATGTAGTFNANSNSRWVLAQVGSTSSSIQYRLVSAGIRVKYCGSVLDRGGIYYGLLQPNHESMTTYSATDILKYDEASYDPVKAPDSGWYTLTYRPVDETDCEWQKSTSTGPCAEDMIMGILITAPSNDPINFVAEAFANFEIVGTPARAKLPSYADSNGFSAVLTASGISEFVLKAAYTGAQGFGRAVVDRAEQVLTRVMSGVGDNVLPALVAYGTMRGRGNIYPAIRGGTAPPGF